MSHTDAVVSSVEGGGGCLLFSNMGLWGLSHTNTDTDTIVAVIMQVTMLVMRLSRCSQDPTPVLASTIGVKWVRGQPYLQVHDLQQQPQSGAVPQEPEHAQEANAWQVVCREGCEVSPCWGAWVWVLAVTIPNGAYAALQAVNAKEMEPGEAVQSTVITTGSNAGASIHTHTHFTAAPRQGTRRMAVW